jgi:hypothetical protein
MGEFSLNIAYVEFAAMSWRLLDYSEESTSLITTEVKLPVFVG